MGLTVKTHKKFYEIYIQDVYLITRGEKKRCLDPIIIGEQDLQEVESKILKDVLL